MSHHLWKILFNIANLGYVGFALPIAGMLVVWLCARRRWYTAAGCAVAVVGCSACIFLLKLAFFTGNLRLPALALQNPSGHSAIGAVVYGSLAWIVSREMPGWPGRALLLLTCFGVAVIGASLYIIGSHTLPDVLAGLTMGGAWAVGFALFGFHDETPTRRFPAGLILVIATTAVSLQSFNLVPHFEPSNLLFLVAVDDGTGPSTWRRSRSSPLPGRHGAISSSADGGDRCPVQQTGAQPGDAPQRNC